MESKNKKEKYIKIKNKKVKIPKIKFKIKK